jgi:hypothetical protein
MMTTGYVVHASGAFSRRHGPHGSEKRVFRSSWRIGSLSFTARFGIGVEKSVITFFLTKTWRPPEKGGCSGVAPRAVG